MINKFKIVNVVCLLSVLLFTNGLNWSVKAQTPTQILNAAPQNATLKANTTISFELTFDLTLLPAQSNLQRVSLSYVQSGQSNGSIQLIDTASSTIIVNQSLALAGAFTITDPKLTTTANSWLDNAQTSAKILIQSIGMVDQEQIELSSIRLVVEYQLIDSTLPQISKISTKNIDAFSTLISWETDEPCYSYVEYGKTSQYTFTTTANTLAQTQHSVLLTDLISGTTYHFVVTATDLADNQSSTKDKSFITTLQTDNTNVVDTDLLAAPKNIDIELAENAIHIAWSNVNDIDGYVLFRKTNNESDYKEIARSNKTKYTDTEVNGGTNYSYFVRSYKNNLLSKSSPAKSVYLPSQTNADDNNQDSTESVLQTGLILLALVSIVAISIYLAKKTVSRVKTKKYGGKFSKNPLKDPEYYVSDIESSMLTEDEY